MSKENLFREMLRCKLQMASAVIDILPPPLHEGAQKTLIQALQAWHEESGLFLAKQEQDQDKNVVKPVVIE